RGEHLDVYAARVEKAPSLADIRLSLMCSPPAEPVNPGSVGWLVAGINIENSQDLVRETVHQLPTDPTATQNAGVATKRQGLQSKIQKHQDKGDSFLDGVDIIEHCQPAGALDDMGLL
ncbi:hypothetical protein BS17DRAFT_671169, partial [Gyrodon lividus]